MINKTLLVAILGFSTLIVSSKANVAPTKGAVVLAGSVVASQQDTDTKKHKRKDCPVCKGKGWYISGDGIERVNCGYCYPEDAKVEKTDITIKVIK